MKHPHYFKQTNKQISFQSLMNVCLSIMLSEDDGGNGIDGIHSLIARPLTPIPVPAVFSSAVIKTIVMQIHSVGVSRVLIIIITY